MVDEMGLADDDLTLHSLESEDAHDDGMSELAKLAEQRKEERDSKPSTM